MKTVNLEDYRGKPTQKTTFTMFEKVLKAIGSLFKQKTEDVDKAFEIAGNFDTLVMFCMAAQDLELDVYTVAQMSLKVAIPQTYLREIRTKKEGTNDEPGARIVNFRKDSECK